MYFDFLKFLHLCDPILHVRVTLQDYSVHFFSKYFKILHHEFVILLNGFFCIVMETVDFSLEVYYGFCQGEDLISLELFW